MYNPIAGRFGDFKDTYGHIILFLPFANSTRTMYACMDCLLVIQRVRYDRQHASSRCKPTCYLSRMVRRPARLVTLIFL